jgi:hypothetical protein
MTLSAKPKKNQDKNFIPYSVWSENVLKGIKSLMDECLDRFKEDKKLNAELLKMLSKLQQVVEKKYYEK